MIEIKVPSPGESITEVEISTWLVEDGDYVQKDQEICEIDSDKATLTVSAEDSGKIKILKESEITMRYNCRMLIENFFKMDLGSRSCQ